MNRFAAAGGTQFVFRELIDAGLMHGDIATVVPGGMRAYCDEPRLADGKLDYSPGIEKSADEAVVRPVSDAFDPHGGLRLLRGNLGRSLIKISAVKAEYHRIEAPAVVIDDPRALNKLHAAGVLPQDFIAVVRYQGPRANGMPELHSLAPLLGLLQNQGRRVALVTDGRLSGASGKIPAAIHLTPEAARGGPIGKLREGDMIRLDAAGRHAGSAGRRGRMERTHARAQHRAGGARPGPQPVRLEPQPGDAGRPGRAVDFLRPADSGRRLGIRCGIRAWP